MSNRANRRLERRSEREARRPGAAPRPRRQRSEPPRRRPAGPRRPFNWTPVIVVVAVAVVVGVIIFAVIGQLDSSSANATPWLDAELNDSSSLPGKYIKPHPGPNGKFDGADPNSDDRQHVAAGVKIPICTPEQIAADEAKDVYADRTDVANCYTSNPPTSGPHSVTPQEFKFLENPAPKENLLHNMEHGGIVIWYNSDDANLLKQLSDLVKSNVDRRHLVVASKYTEMEPNTIAVTSWTRIDKFSAGDFTKERVQKFIDAHNKRFNPEGF